MLDETSPGRAAVCIRAPTCLTRPVAGLKRRIGPAGAIVLALAPSSDGGVAGGLGQARLIQRPHRGAAQSPDSCDGSGCGKEQPLCRCRCAR